MVPTSILISLTVTRDVPTMMATTRDSGRDGSQGRGQDRRGDPGRIGRFSRGQSEETGFASIASGRYTGINNIKRRDIGILDPYKADKEDIGMISDGKDLFTDVYCFSERIQTFMEDPTTREESVPDPSRPVPQPFGGPAK